MESRLGSLVVQRPKVGGLLHLRLESTVQRLSKGTAAPLEPLFPLCHDNVMLVLISTAVLFLSASPESEAIQAATAQEVAQAFRRVGLKDEAFDSLSERKKLKRLGFDEAKLLSLVEGLFAVCLHEGTKCDSEKPSKQEQERIDNGRELLTLLGNVGTHASLPLLWRLSGRGFSWAQDARLRVYEKDMAKQIASHQCKSPSVAEVAAMRETLGDFVVIRSKGTSLILDIPTAAEADDLAYFLAAVAETGAPVGEASRQHGSWMTPGPKNETRTKLLLQFEDAQSRGDSTAIGAAAQTYLQTFGFPTAFNGKDEAIYSWGGARYSNVMRELADVDESQGNDTEAASLYRLADPGGGACGSSVDSRWKNQVKGLIRAEEKAGRCRSVVPERLLDLNEYGAPDGIYGPDRLAKAGFDVARLYRGALVTAYRDADEKALRALFAADPTPLGKKATGRLKRQGPEAWESRVYALEGWVDIAKKKAVPRLTEFALAGPSTRKRRWSLTGLKRRAMSALGELARRPKNDPCNPERRISFFSSFSSTWHREVKTLEGCGEVLTKQERDGLSAQLLPLLGSDDDSLQTEAVNLLGAIASPISVPHLETLLGNRNKNGETCTSTGNGQPDCHDSYPAREAAREAMVRIRGFEKAE